MLDLGIRLALCTGLAAALGGAVLAFGHHERDVGRAEVRAQWTADTVTRQQAEIINQQADAAETQRRINAIQEIVNEAKKDAATAQADAAGARSERDRLRRQQSAYLDAARALDHAGDPTPSGKCQATAAAADLFSDLFSESDEGAGILAAALDSARAAGLACERAYSALTQH